MFYVQGPPYYINQPPGLTNSDQPLLATITSCGHSPKLSQVLPGGLITPGCVARNLLVSHPVTLSLAEFSIVMNRTCKYSLYRLQICFLQPRPQAWCWGLHPLTVARAQKSDSKSFPNSFFFFLRKKKSRGKLEMV